MSQPYVHVLPQTSEKGKHLDPHKLWHVLDAIGLPARRESINATVLLRRVESIYRAIGRGRGCEFTADRINLTSIRKILSHLSRLAKEAIAAQGADALIIIQLPKSEVA